MYQHLLIANDNSGIFRELVELCNRPHRPPVARPHQAGLSGAAGRLPHTHSGPGLLHTSVCRPTCSGLCRAREPHDVWSSESGFSRLAERFGDSSM